MLAGPCFFFVDVSLVIDIHLSGSAIFFQVPFDDKLHLKYQMLQLNTFA